MPTPESKIKKQIKQVLKHHGVYSHMPVQNGMGAPTLDFICCAFGLYIGIEAKAPGKSPTARQLDTMQTIRKHGGLAFVVGDESGVIKLDKLLADIKLVVSSTGEPLTPFSIHRLLCKTSALEFYYRQRLKEMEDSVGCFL